MTLPHSAQKNMNEKGKSKKVASRKKFALGLLQQVLVHRSTRYLMAGDTANCWKNV